jgi:hypothetical protein
MRDIFEIRKKANFENDYMTRKLQMLWGQFKEYKRQRSKLD